MLRKMIGDVRRLVRDEHVDLMVEAPNWVVTLRLVHDLALLASATMAAAAALGDDPNMLLQVGVLLWLVGDTVVRWYAANDRSRFLRISWPELLAVVPLDLMFGVSLWALWRVAAIVRRAVLGLRDVLHLTGGRLIGVLSVTLMGVGGLSLVAVEDGVESAADGLWWAVVTMTTVGYGDISPVTLEGRVIAAVLMVAGIGLIGLVTGNVAEKLTRRRTGVDRQPDNPAVDHLVAKLQTWDELLPDERRRCCAALVELAEEDAAGNHTGEDTTHEPG